MVWARFSWKGNKLSENLPSIIDDRASDLMTVVDNLVYIHNATAQWSILLIIYHIAVLIGPNPDLGGIDKSGKYGICICMYVHPFTNPEIEMSDDRYKTR